VVVHRRRAARARERGQPGARRRPLDLLVDLRPDRVQLHQPLEQRRLLGEPARRPLEEVVVAVDQPRRRQAATRVDPRRLAAEAGRGARADGHDPVALDHDVPIGVLGAGGVDRRDRAALEDRPPRRHGTRARRRADRRTASRICS
jgi:hypothetical protein